jgi:low affinity Fe/Cu permease
MHTADRYSRFAKGAARITARPGAFIVCALVVVAWVVSGPLFGFSDTWQLVINTGTTIVTFLMVFLIQNTQTRDTEAMQVKLDELIRATRGAHTALLDLEELEDATLERYQALYRQLATDARSRLERGEQDTDTPDLEAQSGRGPGKGR